MAIRWNETRKISAGKIHNCVSWSCSFAQQRLPHEGFLYVAIKRAVRFRSVFRCCELLTLSAVVADITTVVTIGATSVRGWAVVARQRWRIAVRSNLIGALVRQQFGRERAWTVSSVVLRFVLFRFFKKTPRVLRGNYNRVSMTSHTAQVRF